MEKLNYNDLKIRWEDDIDITDHTLTLVLECAKDKVINIIDKFREEKGFTDKASSSDNEVYYNLYFVYDLATNSYHVEVVVNNSEKDDYTLYEFGLEISDSDLKSILASLYKRRIRI